MALRNLHLLGEARYYRDYLRKMIDVANALIFVIDRDARIAVMNVAMQRYLGLGPDIIGTPLAEPSREERALRAAPGRARCSMGCPDGRTRTPR